MTQQAQPVKPWYKHGWPWVFIGISVITLVVSFGLAWIAVHNKDSEVRDDWYADGKSINQELARDDYATALSIRADLSFKEQTVKVSVAARYAIPTESLPASLALAFSHPTDSGKDVSLSLARQADGSYTGTLPKALAGRYYVELGCKNWRLRTENIFPREALELSAEPPRS